MSAGTQLLSLLRCSFFFLNVDVNKCLSGLWASLPPSRPGIEKLENAMTRLRDKRDDIKNQIREAEREGKIPTDRVNRWLQKVGELECQVVDIKQDFQSSCFSCHCFNQTGGTSSQTQQAGDQVSIRESSNCCSIIERAAKKLGEANELMSQAGALNPVVTIGPPEPTVMLPISHQPPVGIESYVKDIVGYIDGGEGNIIGIYGMAGVGKTTMLNSIQLHYLHNHTIFDHVIWVVASKDCQLKRLQEEIAKNLGLMTLQEKDDEKACGDKLFSYLKDKKCLLFLDDIWERLDLQLLGMAHSATERGQQQQQRKVVVFTTCIQTVCDQMDAKKEFKVECLNPDQAWQLFEQNSNMDVLSSDGGIKHLAQELAKECAGLPFSLITVARFMSGKRSWEAWNGVLDQIRDKHEWTTLSKDPIMHKFFKLSYGSLENDFIRQCLLCCALWPANYEINIFNELIPCWIGCGLIREFNVINEAFTKGCSHLDALVAASLLEHSSEQYYTGKYVKMNDVIRDIALLMVSELEEDKRKWIVKAGIRLKYLPSQEEWQAVELASFMHNDIASLPYQACTFPKLSVLILQNNLHLKEISSTFFPRMGLLTYLDLSNSCTTVLPKEIGSLIELQYLNLSFNPITRLPAEFGCLNKLQYLLLCYTELHTVPNGAISNLSMLKWLDIRGIILIRKRWWDELKCFKGCHRITLGIAINATEANFKRLKELKNVSVWDLTVGEWPSLGPPNDYLGTPQWCSGVSDYLESLTITNVAVNKLKWIAGVRCESDFRRLKILCLSKLTLLENILLNGVGFYSLRDLYIYKCPKLKDVSWVLQLPCLSVLMISNCLEMEELISSVGSSNPSFGIKRLTLSSMENLRLIAHQPLNFFCLEYMQVYQCPKFKKLPFGAELLASRLKEIEGEQTWWGNLEWDDESNKNSFTRRFKLLTERAQISIFGRELATDYQDYIWNSQLDLENFKRP